MTSALQDIKSLNQRSQTHYLQIAPDVKGDVFADPNLITKTPGKFSNPDCQFNMGSLTTPTKGRNASSCEPWTPTSNLKMLISAASPEIRNRERELSKEDIEEVTVEDSSQIEQETELGEEGEKLQISRKEKSLGLLCQKFLARYPDNPNPAINNDICLDDVAGELNVERRRIYDIMNVLESLHMVSRLAKNRYRWHGRFNLPQTLAMLRQVGEEQRYSQQMERIRQWTLEKELREYDVDSDEKENDEAFLQEVDGENGQREVCFVELPGLEFRGASVNSRKDKSLRVMSQKFVMLFLVSTPRVVSLEVAAKILIGEDQVDDINKCKFKTKIRRLYDIANVLSSLELIKKVHVADERGRKPAFKWTGPEDLPSPKEIPKATSTTATTRPLESRSSVENCAKNLFSSPGGKRGFTRHPSLIKMVKSIQDDRRKINSAPSSPTRAVTNGSTSPIFPSSKMAQLAAICKIQLDQQSKKQPIDVKSSPSVDICHAKPEESGAQPTEEKPTVWLTSSESQMKDSTGMALPLLTPTTLPHIPASCSPLIPILLPQHQVGGPITVYMHPASIRAHALSRPLPTSQAVRSMTFESPGEKSSCGDGSHSPVADSGETLSPSSSKRKCEDKTCYVNSPSKMKKINGSSGCLSPKLGEILQARLKARRGGLVSSRPSPRALHLDPEFTKPAPTNGQSLEHSVETFLEKEEKAMASDSETCLTPLHPTQIQNHSTSPLAQEVMLPAGHLHAETLIPTGYLIPITPQSLFSYKDSNGANGETGKVLTPTNIYKTPTAGSRTLLHSQEFTPTSMPLHTASISPFPTHVQRTQSPSPAILNFTLQNIGLIPAGAAAPGSATLGSEQHVSPLPTSHIGLPHRGMIFVKPMSPAGTLQSVTASQPLTLISLPQQPLMATPKGSSCIQHSLFHTPSPVSSVTPLSTGVTAKNLYIPQRKLDVSPEEA